MRKVRLIGGLNDLSKIMKAVNSRAKTSNDPSSDFFFFTLFSGLLRMLYICCLKRGFSRNWVVRSALLTVCCNMMLSREKGSVLVEPLCV